MLQKQIYSPNTLYADFNPSLPLRDSVVSDEKVGDVIYNEVYFNGRETSEGRVLIYGIYARHADGKRHNAILVIPDYNTGLDINIVNLYVKLGYDVLTFDYKGECDNQENYTNYPSDIKYANLKYAGKHLDYVENTAKQTCWYEWCCVARYAVSFLKSRIETNKIGVLGIKSGSEIMWHLIATDTRITCAVGLFGAGWRAYKNVRKHSNDMGFVVDDERIRFISGIDPHVYAPYCKCPVALLTATNNGEYDADRAHDTIRRVGENIDSFFCLSPRLSDAIDSNCMKNIELFFGIYLNGQRIKKLNEPRLDIDVNGEEVKVFVEADPDGYPKRAEIYVCENQIIPSKRNWIKLLVEREADNSFKSKYNLVNGGGVIFAFAVVEYRNGITVSSPIMYKKCPKTAVIKTNLLYSSDQGTGDFSYGYNERDLLGGAIYYKRSPLTMVKGAMNINGVSSRTGLVTYKVSENRVQMTMDSVFKLDVYCNDEITLFIRLFTDYGTKRQKSYTVEIDVPKGEVWQNVVVGVKDFKTREGMPVPDCSLIDRIKFKADGFFAINNVLLI